jgi:zinc protease
MRKLLKNLSVVFLIMGILIPAISLAQGNNNLPKINYQEYKLKNGLTVVLHQDKSTPIVAVNVFYHVGSKNETPGRTGFAHLFEHMMFQGSKNYVSDYLTAIDDMGGNVNGTTDEDRTWYFETVPSNFLERTLYLEADRMGNLLEAMTQEKLDNQRDVVKNERRLRIDNVPYGTSFERIGALMYPEGHPYNWSVIGSMADLSAASMEDVKSFFRTYYVPNNATLVLAGDFDEKQTKDWIEKYFGPIAKGADVKRPTNPQPKLSGEVRKTYEDVVPFPRLSLVWHGVPQYSADEAALDMLASILSQGRGSRLQSNLNFGKELVSQIFAGNGTSEIGGLFQISALARPGKTLEEIEKEINLEIERIKKDAPTAEEMTRVLNARESSFVYGLQSVAGKGGQLANYAGFLKKPDYFQSDLDRYRKVTPADVQRVANQYLTANRLVMSYVPGKPAATTNAATDKPATTKAAELDKDLIARQKAALPKAGPAPKLSLPSIEKTKLSNGLNVWFVRQNELPIVSMNLVFNSGSILDSADKYGAASWTASLLNQGTTTRSAVEIANQLQSIGASVNANSGWDSSTVSLQTLTKNLDPALNIYADIITNASFPASEIESLRRRALINLTQRKSQPSAVAGLAFNKVLYGDQPYGRDSTETSVKAITREDLVNFHKNNYVPNNATLIVVGDVDSRTMLPKLESAFANWKSGNPVSVPSSAQTMKGQPGIYIIDKPGAAQSTIAAGVVGIDRNNPDYYAVEIMNAILGGGSSGRLFKILREEKGYTYGAYSSFSTRRGAGPFRAGGDFQTGSTKESVTELIKLIDGMRGAMPVTQAELDSSKFAVVNGYPQGFETVGQISGQLSNLVVYGLPDSYFNDYITKINAVTLQDVNRVANKYLDPSKMAIVVVGDRKVIEPGLKQLGYSINILDAEGNPIGN